MPRTAVLVYRDGPGTKPPLTEWLETLRKPERKAYAKCLAYIKLLEQDGCALRPPASKYLGEGMDLYELRIRVGSVNYRLLYFFCGKDIACLSHGLTKEDVVPDTDIQIAIRRMKLVRLDRNRYTQTWEIPT